MIKKFYDAILPYRQVIECPRFRSILHTFYMINDWVNSLSNESWSDIRPILF